MVLKTLLILGFRGFEARATIDFAVPNGKRGSGLTVITGANNTGKTAILECIRARAGYTEFHPGYRNSKIDEVHLHFTFEDGTEEIRSLRKGDSRIKHECHPKRRPNILVIPSRRSIPPALGTRGSLSREDYIGSLGLRNNRAGIFDFPNRLHRINEDPVNFNQLLTFILGFQPTWTIDSGSDGNHFVRYWKNDVAHTGEGLGDGILNAFIVADALYDSQEKEMICFDEPELSLHPSAQKRTMDVFLEYSKTRQIVVTTHSPYFVDAESILNGGSVARTSGVNGSSELHQITDTSRKAIANLTGRSGSMLGNINSPHVFGLDAKEMFFQEDGIIVAEGSDDVQLIPHAAEQLGASTGGNWYGWGAGGAGNIPHICTVLKELGFKRVAGILDGDKSAEIPRLEAAFPSYCFVALPSKDIRTKKPRGPSAAVHGLLDEAFEVRPEYREQAIAIFTRVAEYVTKEPIAYS